MRTAATSAVVAVTLLGGAAAGGDRTASWTGVADRVRRLECAYHASRGHRRAANGDLRGAIQAYSAAIALDPGSPELHLRLGFAFERWSEWWRPGDPGREEAQRGAVASYRLAATRSPALRDLATARLARLHAPGALGERGLLEGDLALLFASGAASPDETLALARLREDAGRTGEAEAALLAARNAWPESAAVHHELARFYRRHERLAACGAALRQRLAKAPDDPDALLASVEVAYYQARRGLGLGAEARRALIQLGLRSAGRLLRAEPNHAAATQYQALLLQLRRESSEASE